MSFEDINKALCAVTKELIEEVATTYPDLFITNGVTDIHKVLYCLGFKLDEKDYLKGVRTVEDVIIRCMDKPYMTYTTDLYTGRLRKAVDSVDSKGNITYHKTRFHNMKYLYDRYEVLQPVHLEKYIDMSNLVNVLEIGSYNYYMKLKG